VGKADVVEFHREKAPDGKTIWRPFPVEYKRGRPKKNNCDKIQLCAQALCIGRIPLNMLSMRLVLELILILFLSVVVFVIRKKTALFGRIVPCLACADAISHHPLRPALLFSCANCCPAEEIMACGA
jgi:hypothetical protein